MLDICFLMQYNIHWRLQKMDKTFDKILSDIILTLGISPSTVGSLYLSEAVKMMIEKPELKMSITKGLYKELAEKFNTKQANIERGIRHAIDVSCAKNRIVELNKIFKVKIYKRNERPSNSEIISLLAERIPYLMNKK